MPAPDLLLTPQDLTEIVESVSRTLAQVVKSEKDRLAKADDNDADDKPDDSDPAAGAPPAEGSAPSDGAPPGAPGDDALDGPPPAEGSAPADPAGDQPPDPAALKAEYAALPVDQLKMHVEAAQAALAEAMGGGDASAAAGAPPGPPAGAPPGPPAMKSQPSMGGSGGESVKVLKSEVSALGEKLKAKDAELAELKKNLEVATEGLGKLAGAFEAFNGRPMRKALTEPVRKSDEATAPLDPTVVKARLRAKIRDTKLTKSDRENINTYLLDPKKADLVAIANLLKD